MANDVETPLASLLRRHLTDRRIGQKKAALAAGLNETYVRDILKGKSKSPQAPELARLAVVLEIDRAEILSAAAASNSGEFLQDAEERVLLAAWRQLPDDERQRMLEYIKFRLSKIATSYNPEPARERV